MTDAWQQRNEVQADMWDQALQSFHEQDVALQECWVSTELAVLCTAPVSSTLLCDHFACQACPRCTLATFSIHTLVARLLFADRLVAGQCLGWQCIHAHT